jgi:hypothetical protein
MINLEAGNILLGWLFHAMITDVRHQMRKHRS